VKGYHETQSNNTDNNLEYKYRLMIHYQSMTNLSSFVPNPQIENVILSYLFYKINYELIMNFNHKILTIIEYKNNYDNKDNLETKSNNKLEWIQSYQIVYFPLESIDEEDKKALTINPSSKFNAIRSEGWLNINNLKTGIWNHYYREGNIQAYFTHVDGILNGSYEIYHSTLSQDNLKGYHSTLSQDNLKGYHSTLSQDNLKGYHSNRQLKVKGEMVNDLKESWCYTFYLLGSKHLATFYKNGKKHNKEYCWYENGYLKSITPYNDDSIHGCYEEWNNLENKNPVENQFTPHKEQKLSKFIEYNNGKIVKI
jgi:antitoxin component YwqK of YwqJK toxin-antitoxin module